MELAPEKLIEMLEKGESLPNVILMYGEEPYYRSKAAACIKKYVFGSAADEDMEISVFDRDTDLKRLNAAVNSYPFFGGSSLVIISDDKIFAAEKKQKENADKGGEDVGSNFGKHTGVLPCVYQRKQNRQARPPL